MTAPLREGSAVVRRGRRFAGLVGGVLALLAMGVGDVGAHPDSPGSLPLVPAPLPLTHRTPAEIVALLAREEAVTGSERHVPRAARTDNAAALLPSGVDAVLRTGEPGQVVVVGTGANLPELEACIRVLDVPVQATGPDRRRMVLTLQRGNGGRVRKAVSALPGAGSAAAKGRQLVLEGSAAWLHQALRAVIRAELGLR